jgi:POT family proton-dependent oligopeptide transporter
MKPNISTMGEDCTRKVIFDAIKGLVFFYIGINTGSLLATMVIGFVVVKWGWHAGFGLAGIACFGILLFIFGDKIFNPCW